jgi:hypothetical protein
MFPLLNAETNRRVYVSIALTGLNASILADPGYVFLVLRPAGNAERRTPKR